MEVQTYAVKLYIAGDIETAKRLLRRSCYQEGLCVTVEPITFLYTGGEESGMAIGFVNYPRFPSEPSAIFARAYGIARDLIDELCQKSALLVATDKTVWVSVDPPGMEN